MPKSWGNYFCRRHAQSPHFCIYSLMQEPETVFSSSVTIP